jgi:hypothetical protein
LARYSGTRRCLAFEWNGEDRFALLQVARVNRREILKKGMDAARLIKEVGGIIGGSGGGRPDFAQAGGTKPENLEKALQELEKLKEEEAEEVRREHLDMLRKLAKQYPTEAMNFATKTTSPSTTNRTRKKTR